MSQSEIIAPILSYDDINRHAEDFLRHVGDNRKGAKSNRGGSLSIVANNLTPEPWFL